jgi:peptidoglycan hydrolase-like protein with peptidoglycan-binding domain
MSGDDVRKVQQALKDRDYFPPEEVIDGVYGPNTEGKVKAFQQDRRLKVDGIVGQQTWRALGLD